jgi:hypothetical protein
MDFKSQLVKQLGYIQTSCREVDRGNWDEAIRIALAIRVLAHDTQRSTSILQHLKVKKTIRLLSTATYRPDGKPTAVGAITDMRLHAMQKVEHVPRMATSQRNELVKFNWWWDTEIIFILDSGGKLTRKGLVLEAANTDGGGHVDKEYNPTYEELLQGQGLSMTVHPTNAPQFTAKSKQPHLAAIRQMAYEILHSPDIRHLVS